ncbi:class I SAM-dependent methyltransferase [Candidatus Methylacidiphilum infernorum]|uniref:Class I SAM-dependent methyltransferase n=1 Tax=Candidatus Methylacidiphilum infernorum TaxID=511746 RepID=A0ABX7PXT9_9BACT|nr:class I SAM-dependent methyltransferase [Candidatus Methylacidiphilum infernorum]QSR87538.1 class I SAM-dependent methyltransferase [Candidatus Methylacidiphilum infernorum]
MWIDSDILQYFQRSATDIHRVHSSNCGWIERYGEDFVLVLNHEEEKERLIDALLGWCSRQGIPCKRIFLKKRFAKEKPISTALSLVYGESSLPMHTVCRENGLYFSIRFDQGGSAGLFMDQRQNRLFLKKRPVSRLLNLFAFSCSFGLCGALAGAESWNVDLSPRFLEWGKENYKLNGVDPAAHRFWAMDVREALKIFKKRGIMFDHIILDPPTFSCGRKGANFSLARDFESLLETILELGSGEKTTLFLSANYKPWKTKDLLLKARKTAAAKKRRLHLLHGPFPLPDIPRNELPASCWIELES